jgi:hypothetical protein
MHHGSVSVHQTTKEAVVIEEKNKKTKDARISSKDVANEEGRNVCTSLTRKISKLEIEFDKTSEESLLKGIEELKKKRKDIASRVESEIDGVATQLDHIRRNESPYPYLDKKQ